MPSPVGTSTASLLDGAVTDTTIVVMGLMKITAPHVDQPPAHRTFFLAPTETVSQKHGCAMPSTTVVMDLMRETAVSYARQCFGVNFYLKNLNGTQRFYIIFRTNTLVNTVISQWHKKHTLSCTPLS